MAARHLASPVHVELPVPFSFAPTCRTAVSATRRRLLACVQARIMFVGWSTSISEETHVSGEAVETRTVFRCIHRSGRGSAPPEGRPLPLRTRLLSDAGLRLRALRQPWRCADALRIVGERNAARRSNRPPPRRQEPPRAVHHRQGRAR